MWAASSSVVGSRAEFLLHHTLQADQFIDGLNHANGNPDRAGLRAGRLTSARTMSEAKVCRNR
jgi:hypothetical protein